MSPRAGSASSVRRPVSPAPGKPSTRWWTRSNRRTRAQSCSGSNLPRPPSFRRSPIHSPISTRKPLWTRIRTGTKRTFWARAQNVLFVPVRILVQSGFLVDIGEWIGERRKEGGRGKFEPEHDCARVRRFDLVHHRVEGLPGAGDTGRRTDDALPARGDIGGRQRRPIMKFHPVADFEGVGFVVIGGPRHLGAEVADKIAGRRRVFRVDANEDT